MVILLTLWHVIFVRLWLNCLPTCVLWASSSNGTQHDILWQARMLSHPKKGIHTELRLHHSILPSQSSGLPTFCFEDIFHLSVTPSWSTSHRIGCEQQQIRQVEKSQGLIKAWKHKYFARPFGSESHETSSFHCLLSQNLAQSSLWLVGWGRKIIISLGYTDSVLW